MTKAAEMAKVSAKGGFHILWGLIVSTLISALGTIIIANLLGPDNYGLYAIALTAPNLISIFRDWGINSAIIKYSAQYKSEKNVAKIKSVFISGLAFEIILGLSLSIVSFFLSGFLALNFNRPTMAPLIQIASFFILTGALVNTASAAFTGVETMHLNSIVLIIQSIVKTGLIIGLLLLGLGTIGAITGFTMAVLVAGLAGLFLMWTAYKSLPKPTESKLEIFTTIKTMFKYGMPLSISTIIGGFLSQFYNYILAIYVTSNATIGNYNVALNFVVLINFFAIPVTTMMFPAFSKLNAQKDKETLKTVFQYSVKYAALVVVPVTVMVMALAQPAIGTLFQNKYTEAPLFLALLSTTYLLSALGSLSEGNLIIGQGYTTFNLKLTILGTGIGLPLGYVLISQFGVIGLIVTTFVVSIPSLFIGLRFIRKHFGVSVDWISSVKILFSSAVAGILTFIVITNLALSNITLLVMGIVIFPIAYITVALATKTINQTDSNNLREIILSLGPLRKPMLFLLKLIERFMAIIDT